jgi:hypothetical protein
MTINVIGNGLDALICSKKLLELGHQVHLISTTKNLGGHFLGHRNSHGKFDTGMVLLENDHRFTPTIELQKYGNQFGRNLRPFLRESFEWLESVAEELHHEIVLTRLSEGSEVPDYFIADNLNFLDTLSEDVRNDLLSNLEKFLFQTSTEWKIQPSQKMTDKAFDTLTIDEYYSRVFGQKFYNLFFQNFLSNVSADFSIQRARDHRKFWLPLYFPESIYFHLTQNSTFKNFYLPEVKFDKPKKMMISDLITKIVEEIFVHPNFQFIQLETFAGFKAIQTKKERTLLFLTADQIQSLFPNSKEITILCSQLATALSVFASTTINVVHVCIPKSPNRTVFFQKDTQGLFRYSISQQRANDINSVASFEFSDAQDFDLKNSLEIIRGLGFEFLCQGSHIPAPLKIRALELSEKEWLNIVDRYIAEYQKNAVIGPVIHPEATSFNDNLVRGLAFAAKVR